MSNLIVIKIVPQAPLDPGTFSSYLSALGGLQITAFDLSFNSPTSGQSVGTASFIAPTTPPFPPVSIPNPPPGFVPTPAQYPTGITNGIIQQYDLDAGPTPPVTFPPTTQSQFYQLESVATAVIQIPSPLAGQTAFENLSLQMSWGSGAGSQSIPVALEYYDVALAPGPTPDPNVTSWATLSPSLYLTLPAPPTSAGASPFTLPSNGTVPPFDALLGAVNAVLNVDPGPATTATTNGTTAVGGNVLDFPSTTGITVGMAVSGTGIPNGTSVSATTSTSVTLSQPVSPQVPSGTLITFTPDLGNLSLDQCRNIAYEIIWSQQGPLPAVPDPTDRPLEDLYTNPPNNGVLLANTTTNQNEGDRKQFEAALQSYYITADANADRLTNYVYALAAAVACEAMSMAATQALLELPVNPGQAGYAPLSDTELILTGLGNVSPPTNFGVPAAYFYALGVSMPTQMAPSQRYQLATGDQIEHLLAELTSAISNKTVTDSEKFTSLPPATAPSINAAQAARRLSVLAIPAGSTTPLAPLDTVSLLTTQPTTTGNVLTFNSTNAVTTGMSVSGTNIPSNTTVSAVTPTTVTLTPVVSVNVPIGTAVTVTPAFTTDLQQLMQEWLDYPPSVPGSTSPSSQTYQPGTDDVAFWPKAANDHQAAFLNLILCALTQGYIIPAPFSVSLGDQITTQLLTNLAKPSPPTVATLASVTVQQWTSLFQSNPTWLPSFTQPGNTEEQIAAFIRYVKKFFGVGTSGQASSINLATSADTLSGSVLPFVSTTGIAATMSASAPGFIQAGTAVTLPITSTSVTLSNPVLKEVPKGTNITFAPNYSAAASGGPPVLQPLATDWLTACLTKYGAFSFGTTGFNLTQLQAAAASVFANDQAAQDWLVDALVTIDNLYQILKGIPLTVPSTNTQNFEFSLVEALYARGFKSAADVTEFSSTDFSQALIGTVAYDYAGAIYTSSAKISPSPSAPSQPGSGFVPVNPHGSLTNCIPPDCLSPLGPIAYLSEMLQVSQSSTCETPLTPSATNTLGTVIAQRRGPLPNLSASCANLETPLPLMDLVNECLEYVGSVVSPTGNATQPPPGGTVYDTSADKLAGYALCNEADCPKEDKESCCHDPAKIFAALPEYSTPATPTTNNQAVEPLVCNNLKVDFSSCHLPYSQALDVSRAYLRHFRTSRFEEMRTFRKCITEFVLDPINQPPDFQSYLWRYPVRIDIAIEYLGITPEEYRLLFKGTSPRRCGKPVDDDVSPVTGALPTWELYGFASDGGDNSWTKTVVILSEFLRRTCLTYCEFLELWKSGFVAFTNASRDSDIRNAQPFPDCEPCCLENFVIQFEATQDPQQPLGQLAIFIRLWRKLKEHCGEGYSFSQLADICNVLALFPSSGPITPNPDFIRQLAAFQMLRDHFNLPLVDHADHTAGTTGADRTHLLALWVGKSAKKWTWALGRLLEGIESDARRRYGCERPHHERDAHLADNLDALSQLAGFNPLVTTDTWNSRPACTLRFAEVLAKICGSGFRVGEVRYLFNAEHPQDCEDPFVLQDPEDALNNPLDLPENDEHFSLWKLREALLAVEVCEDEACEWTWPRLVAEFRDKFGYAPPSGQEPLLSIGHHFFPCVLEASGFSVSGTQRQYRTNLTSTAPWNSPPGSPFHYDASSTPPALWTQIPLSDEAVIGKLSQMPELTTPADQAAVQDLYFMPRADLAFVAFLFPDWQSAELHLIEECDEAKRWAYFRHHFALANARRKVIAEHLAKHVAHRTGCSHQELDGAAAVVLSRLFSDENAPTPPWEANISGATPQVTWTPPPSGGAIAALLGLIGTGLLGEYEIAKPRDDQDNTKAPADVGTAYQVIWREVRAPFEAFGHERNEANSPVPTVLPALNLSLTSGQTQFVTLHNGYTVRTSDGRRLGGAEAFQVRWSGVLLVECEGEYEFHAGAPTPEGEKPDFERAEKCSWRVTLKRGQKTWVVLSHQWPGETGHERSAPRLRRGAYQIVIEFNQPAPDLTVASHVHPQHTGFQVKYAGPDSGDCLIAPPLKHLYRDFQDQTLAQGIPFLQGSTFAKAFLSAFYTSTLRDIRRTYQRAFKAVLFAGRFGLSGRPVAEDCQSELGYMLANAANFAGSAYERTSSTTFEPHPANFDFNFLPLQDNYHEPAPAAGAPPDRSHPSLQRTQAMFDWWERIFDYDLVRKEVHRRSKGHLWLLFLEALVKQPADPGQLLRHIGADPKYWNLDLRFFQDQNSAIYSVTSTDLEDDRWLVRVWHADHWIRGLLQRFCPKDISKARPDLWASDNPGATVPPSGEPETGNANLSAFLTDGCLENGEPRRYGDLKRLNDGLRERGRDALLHYLCRMKRVLLPWGSGLYATVPRELSDFFLIDVQTGICEKASRIEEAITAVQNFVRRARLHLEPGWKVTREFARMWDRLFASFHVWQACKSRHLYKENWIEWSELDRARRVEGFRFLESQLRSSSLTVAVPGGLDWWPDERPPVHHGLEVVQKHEPAEMQVLLPNPRQGLNLLATPEHDARPSWLTAIQPSTASGPAGSASPSTTNGTLPLPFWMQAAIRLGTRFYRIAAAGTPPAGASFEPHSAHHGEKGCVPCCVECGCSHPPLVDEYYFWLVGGSFYVPPVPTSGSPATSPGGTTSGPQTTSPDDYQYGFQDDYYDPNQQESAYWQDATQLPQLLEWPSLPMVRLAWCRVHNGEFQQPRRSHQGVPVTDIPSADFTFLGRAADSLFFSVTNPAVPPPAPVMGDPSPPGFRYDIAIDHAVVLPLVTAAAASTVTYPGSLPAYPYFVFDTPGTHLVPLSPFSPALAVASALRSHCRFEAALKWYRLAFDPLTSDCTWVHCEKDSPPPTPPPPPPPPPPNVSDVAKPPAASDDVIRGGPSNLACCDSTDVSCAIARDRSIILHYLETLRDFGDAVMRRNSPEAFQHARLIFDTARMILGKRPCNVRLAEPAAPPPVGSFKPYFAALNPRLLDLYDVIWDRLGLIHACLNSRRLRNGHPDCDIPYFGDNPLREGWRTAVETCAQEGDWCYLHSPYRFVFLVQKAQEFASRVRELGAQLLSAFEKGDAEYLASLRAGQERELLSVLLDAKKDQWRDADWQVEALQKTKAVSQANLKYYNGLIQNGLINDEIQYQDFTIASTVLRAAGDISEGIAAGVGAIPNMFTGVAGFGGSPLFYIQLPVGSPLAEIFSIAARIMNGLAEIATSTAGLQLTEGGWQRRSDEWIHQIQILTIEIEQTEQQILGAQRRRDQALLELNSHERQMEQSAQVENFLRDKFTAHDLYLFQQKETASLCYNVYDLALYAARQAERAFNFERGHNTRRFIPECAWDTLQEGLMAGERLDVALRHMEKAYLDENIREYELTKHFSLRLHFPMAYLRLRTTGYCEIEIPEWMFDLDFPGQYMRRIKNVTLTIPCVTGPYTGVHCRLTLLSSTTRIDPRLSPPAAHCCCDSRQRSDYECCLDDPRIVKQYAAREAIATSSGQNDSGLFELNFRDERYLPFEFLGAVSRWRIELPPENNYFDLDTLSDLILNLNYTAREGGEMLRRAANEVAQRHLPGNGWSFFDVRHEFPDAWELFRDSLGGRKPARELRLRLGRKLFPYIPGHRELFITGVALLFETLEAAMDACSEGEARACHVVEHMSQHADKGHAEEGCESKATEIPCVVSADWPNLYHGALDTRLGPLRPNGSPHPLVFRFPLGIGEVSRAFLFCRYEVTCSKR